MDSSSRPSINIDSPVISTAVGRSPSGQMAEEIDLGDFGSDCGSPGRRQSLVVIPLDEEDWPHSSLDGPLRAAERPPSEFDANPNSSSPGSARETSRSSSESSIFQSLDSRLTQPTQFAPLQPVSSSVDSPRCSSPPCSRLSCSLASCPPPASLESPSRRSPTCCSALSPPVSSFPRHSAGLGSLPFTSGASQAGGDLEADVVGDSREPVSRSLSPAPPAALGPGLSAQLPAAGSPHAGGWDADTLSDWSVCRRPLGPPAKLFVNAGIPVSFIKGGAWTSSLSSSAPQSAHAICSLPPEDGSGGPGGPVDLRSASLETEADIEVFAHRRFYLNAATVRAAAQADAALHAARTSRQPCAASGSEEAVGAQRRPEAGTETGLPEPVPRPCVDGEEAYASTASERRASSVLMRRARGAEAEGALSEKGGDTDVCATGDASSLETSGPPQAPQAASERTSGSGRRMLWFWGQSRQRTAESQETQHSASSSSAAGVARLLFGSGRRSEEDLAVRTGEGTACGLSEPSRAHPLNQSGGRQLGRSGRDSTELERLLDSENEAALRCRELQESLHREDLEAMLKNVQRVKNFLVVKLRECEAALLATARERNDLEESLRQLGHSLQEKEDQREEVVRLLRRENEQQKVELETLRAEVESLEERRHRLETEVLQLRDEGTLLRAEIHDRVAAGTLATENLQGTVQQLKNEKRVLVREVVSLRRSLAESRQDLANALARVDELEAFAPQPLSSLAADLSSSGKKPRRSTSAGSGRSSAAAREMSNLGHEGASRSAETRDQSPSDCGAPTGFRACEKKLGLSAPFSATFSHGRRASSAGKPLSESSPSRPRPATPETGDSERASETRSRPKRSEPSHVAARSEKTRERRRGWTRPEHVAGRVGGALAAGVSCVLQQLENVLTVEETLIVDASGVYTEDGVCIESLPDSVASMAPGLRAGCRPSASSGLFQKQIDADDEEQRRGDVSLQSRSSFEKAERESRDKAADATAKQRPKSDDSRKAVNSGFPPCFAAKKMHALHTKERRTRVTEGNSPEGSEEEPRKEKRFYSGPDAKESSEEFEQQGKNACAAGDLVVVLSGSEEAAEAGTRECLQRNGDRVLLPTHSLWPKRARKQSGETVGGTMREAVCSVWQAAQDVLAEKTHQFLQPAGSVHSANVCLDPSSDTAEESPVSDTFSESRNAQKSPPTSMSSCPRLCSSACSSSPPSLSTFLLKTVKGAQAQGPSSSPASHASSPWKSLLQRHREARGMPLFGSTPYPSAGGGVAKPAFSETGASVGGRQVSRRQEKEMKPVSVRTRRRQRTREREPEEAESERQRESPGVSGESAGVSGESAGEGRARRARDRKGIGNSVQALCLAQEDAESAKEERERPRMSTRVEGGNTAEEVEEGVPSFGVAEEDRNNAEGVKGDTTHWRTSDARKRGEDDRDEEEATAKGEEESDGGGERAERETEETPEEAREQEKQNEREASLGERGEEGRDEDEKKTEEGEKTDKDSEAVEEGKERLG
ncbi:hypothetical protein TGDOM2_271990 [Toxoplasma gondii GAB2-2007-GAL-DOM2]|uniref:Uncharacterized protein n=5 Tax=Toxoplasma gondii TaxID=5811 RepID=S7WCU0_TOXGG|nr:hypothetical protein TGGT1_271990 [Toxoplasma gondii GT1]KFG43334.1 hypothetical protein TGDOM2_271990 [Toxoplasma gondii GAB2-2007-GAL-DOM2]KFG50430.1 hypothetical protein TGFOU_271990 [Toxoplasma gondii FOU]PUA92250.1 hypothetical protein TGBR9_271990 [Toxoplasma gondii TgCATBr9]